MPKPTLVVAVALLAVTTASAGIPAASEALPATSETLTTNEAPLADAGLDQDVTKGATVLLDATGSRDPDDRIERYDWTIRTPSNATRTPDCADCPRTRFTPTEVGQYRVTVTVTDEDGATASDTLYVDVSPGEKPTLSLSGPGQPTEGDTATYDATLEAGTAALDYVVWTVGGVEIANHSLSADQQTDTATKRFPTAGERAITATVYDVDGQSATSSLAVAVQNQPQQPRRTPGRRLSTASQTAPTVAGDAVVTGTKPLRGSYRVQFDIAGKAVTTVEWRNAAGRIGHGRELTRVWNPGDHELYAVVTYADGSQNVATFADGTTTVVADPRPNVSVGSLDRYGTISGSPTALDGYGNLDTFRVEIDGRTVGTIESTLRGRHRFDADRQRTLPFSYDEFTPGKRYTVTVVATDGRGQTTTVRRELVPVKKPEVVRSEFVNTPVDSYHERIDPERYAAHHVLEIDLNGVDAGKMEVELRPRHGRLKKIDTTEFSQEKRQTDGNLRIDSFWAGEVPKEYEVIITWEISPRTGKSNWKNSHYAGFQVTPSDPELRLNVINDGTAEYVTREHGILVDASGSFDPDGTQLKYIWKYGAEPTKPDNTTAKFRAYERAESIVEDGYDRRTKRNFNFLDYFVPAVADASILGEGPFDPNETVQVRINTEPYHFSKQTYYDDFSLGMRLSNSEARIMEWQTAPAPNSRHSEPTEDAYRYVGVVELPASELAPSGSGSTITVYNEQNRRKTAKAELPEVGLLIKEDEFWENVTVRNLTYLVEKPRINEVTVETKEARDQYLRSGYEIDQREQTTTYVLEKHVKTDNAKYETVTKNLSSRYERNLFLESSTDWYSTGTFQTRETQTRESSKWYSTNQKVIPEWRDSGLWNGEKTGEQREVTVKPAEYQTEKQYRYEYEVEKTDTKTVTKTKTIPVQETETRTVKRCSLRFGCETTTETYTYRTTKTVTYQTTKTYTYTVTKTANYWATSKYDSSHTFTGQTRRIKTQDAVYETQYEVRYKSRHTELVTRYQVARNEMVQEATYEWREQSRTGDYTLARKQALSRDDWRINETTTTAVWTLTRNDGTTRFWTPDYENTNSVTKTSATVTGTVTKQFYNSKTETMTETTEWTTEQYDSKEAKTKKEIIEIVSKNDERVEWCEMKQTCLGE